MEHEGRDELWFCDLVGGDGGQEDGEGEGRVGEEDYGAWESEGEGEEFQDTGYCGV